MVSAELSMHAGQIIDVIASARDADERVRRTLGVIVTSAGDPLPWAEKIKRSGVIWGHVISSVRAAKRCEKAGVDFIVASGHEGGFHIAWEPVHSMVLLPAVVDEVPRIPVAGAGGFCDGRTLAAALALGAAGIQMGTRFLATRECDFPLIWKDHVLKAGDRESLVARGIVGPARFLKTAFAERHAENSLKGSPGVFLGKPDDLSAIPQELLVTELKALEAVYAGNEDGSLFPAGECAQRINDMPAVADMISSVMKEAEQALAGLKNLSA
jgi:enoyl-[acyl-carrier protein] reductase II